MQIVARRCGDRLTLHVDARTISPSYRDRRDRGPTTGISGEIDAQSGNSIASAQADSLILDLD